MKRVTTLTLLLLISASFAGNAYGHGLGQDVALPVIVGEKQITVEASIKPASIPIQASDRPTLIVRTFDQNSNVTIPGIDYRITVELRNDTLLDQRFRSSDGIMLADLIPDKNIKGWQITGQASAGPENQVQVSLGSPVEIRSGMLVNGGLYHITVIVEKGSQGIALQSDIELNLYISVSHAVSFKVDTSEGQQEMVVKTYYDDVTDFSYQNATISFEMPFDWDPAYVKLVPVLHMEVRFPKTIGELQTNSYRGTLNGLDLPAESVQIDDYTSLDNRIVHFVVSKSRLSDVARSLEDGTTTANFTLKPSETPKFPLGLLSAPREKYLLELSWGPEIIETGNPITFVMNIQDPRTGDLARHSSFDFVLSEGANQIYRQHLSSDIGTYSHQYTFSTPGTVTLSAMNINGEAESAKIDLIVLQGSSASLPVEQPSGCLIATAAYGSELSPEVQYLRNFREQHILSSASGSAFMNAFNSIYYSFSPQVADYERQQPWLKATIRAGLYPLFGILMAAERTHSAVVGEAGAILAGATASSLIGTVYLLPAGIILGRRVNIRVLVISLAAVLVFLAASLAFSHSLLPLSTSAFVIAVAGASTISAGKTIVHLWRQKVTSR